GFERRATKLGELVEKEDSVVREAHFAGPRAIASADEADLADRVVRSAKGPRPREPAARREEPGDAVNGGHFKRLVRRQQREERGQAPGQHGLPAPGGPIIAR